MNAVKAGKIAKARRVLPSLALMALFASACGSGGAGKFDTSAADGLSADAATLGGAQAVTAMQRLYKAAAKNGEDTVTVYGPVEESLKPVYDAFTKRFPGIKVVGVPAFGPALDQKISSERASGKHVGDLVHTGTNITGYATSGKLDKFQPATAAGLSDQVADPNQYFYGNQYGAVGFLINTKKITKSAAPQNWAQLGDPKYAGKVVMADPSKPGAMVDGLSSMLYSRNLDQPTLQRIAANRPLIVDSSDLAMQAVVTGQRAVAAGIGFTVYKAAKDKGAPVDIVFPLNGPTPMTVTYYGVLNKPPHPDAAELLETWMFTPEAMKLLPQAGLWGTAKGSPGVSGYPGVDQIQIVKQPPFDQTDKQMKSTIGVMKAIFK